MFSAPHANFSKKNRPKSIFRHFFGKFWPKNRFVFSKRAPPSNLVYIDAPSPPKSATGHGIVSMTLTCYRSRGGDLGEAAGEWDGDRQIRGEAVDGGGDEGNVQGARGGGNKKNNHHYKVLNGNYFDQSCITPRKNAINFLTLSWFFNWWIFLMTLIK